MQNCSFKDEATLVMLARSLHFVLTVLDLVTTNKELRTIWHERQAKILVLVRDLAATRIGEAWGI